MGNESVSKQLCGDNTMWESSVCEHESDSKENFGISENKKHALS